jgi:hypothetical protein
LQVLPKRRDYKAKNRIGKKIANARAEDDS